MHWRPPSAGWNQHEDQASVAWRAGAPLSIEAVDLDGPRDGEVLINARNEGIGGREGFEGM